jgi:hypothetical protein
MGLKKQIVNNEEPIMKVINTGAKKAGKVSKDGKMGTVISYDDFLNYSAKTRGSFINSEDDYGMDDDYSEFGRDIEDVFNVEVKKTHRGDYDIMFNGDRVENLEDWDAFVEEITILDDLMYSTQNIDDWD